MKKLLIILLLLVSYVAFSTSLIRSYVTRRKEDLTPYQADNVDELLKDVLHALYSPDFDAESFSYVLAYLSLSAFKECEIKKGLVFSGFRLKSLSGLIRDSPKDGLKAENKMRLSVELYNYIYE